MRFTNNGHGCPLDSFAPCPAAGAAFPDRIRWALQTRASEVSPAILGQKLTYLHNNPVKAGLVELAEEYIYSSAPAIPGKLGLVNLGSV